MTDALAQLDFEYMQALEADCAELVPKAWERGDLSYKMTEAQRRIRNETRALPRNVRRVVRECCRGFGKSWLEVMEALERLCDPSRPQIYPIYIIGPDIKQTVEIVTPILERVAADAPSGLVRRMKSEQKWRVRNNYLIMRGFERAIIDSLRGQRASDIFVEESRDADPEEYDYAMKDVFGPMVLHSMGKIIESTTSPKNLLHPLITSSIPKAKLQGSYFRYDIYKANYTPEQIETAIDDSGGTETETYRREYLLIHERSAKSVAIPDFISDNHVKDEIVIPPHAFWNVQWDWGGVTDKTVWLLMFWDFLRNKLCVVDELVFEPNTATDIQVKAALEKEQNVPWRLDAFGAPRPVRSADAPGQVQVDLVSLHSYGVFVPAKDEFGASINQLNVAFRQNRIEILRSKCPFLILSLEHGQLNDKRTDYMRSEELGHCDAIACLIYGWRTANKTENPYPAENYGRDAHFVVPRDPHANDKTGLGRALNSWRPSKSIAGGKR